MNKQMVFNQQVYDRLNELSIENGETLKLIKSIIINFEKRIKDLEELNEQ